MELSFKAVKLITLNTNKIIQLYLINYCDYEAFKSKYMYMLLEGMNKKTYFVFN